MPCLSDHSDGGGGTEGPSKNAIHPLPTLLGSLPPFSSPHLPLSCPLLSLPLPHTHPISPIMKTELENSTMFLTGDDEEDGGEGRGGFTHTPCPTISPSLPLSPTF
eukprot:Sspe_Gene.105522::Locus_82549_Transcript_1_1_Confidence_1.000_Length_636::g.105522::m.105522